MRAENGCRCHDETTAPCPKHPGGEPETNVILLVGDEAGRVYYYEVLGPADLDDHYYALGLGVQHVTVDVNAKAAEGYRMVPMFKITKMPSVAPAYFDPAEEAWYIVGEKLCRAKLSRY